MLHVHFTPASASCVLTRVQNIILTIPILVSPTIPRRTTLISILPRKLLLRRQTRVVLRPNLRITSILLVPCNLTTFPQIRTLRLLRTLINIILMNGWSNPRVARCPFLSGGFTIGWSYAGGFAMRDVSIEFRLCGIQVFTGAAFDLARS
jgi:hypothetical protein